eukprot:CAMPEP_0118936036 /NCGR_PEP_ID=MMETSP1169-20130426/15974_1 /TAXON_ID=36882 /ORGANISM="Pyramimonas obovata, Strain CCMP722" /LENGTH=226 /DNA_ID=CAMNT_0006879133 /DNA_START=70 /DNA_END=747 /DNA_ORIENTATION=+
MNAFRIAPSVRASRFAGSGVARFRSTNSIRVVPRFRCRVSKSCVAGGGNSGGIGGTGGRGGGGDGKGNNGDNEDPNYRRRTLLTSLVCGGSMLSLVKSAHAADAKGDLEGMIDKFVDTAAPYASTMGISGIVGFAIAAAGKNIAKGLVTVIGVFLIVEQALAYKGFITINWNEMERQGKALLDINKDGVMDKDDAKFLLKNLVKIAGTGLPSAAGFYAGFLLGLKW